MEPCDAATATRSFQRTLSHSQPAHALLVCSDTSTGAFVLVHLPLAAFSSLCCHSDPPLQLYLQRHLHRRLCARQRRLPGEVPAAVGPGGCGWVMLWSRCGHAVCTVHAVVTLRWACRACRGCWGGPVAVRCGSRTVHHTVAKTSRQCQSAGLVVRSACRHFAAPESILVETSSSTST